jgi:uncharacterized protein (TIGR03435 family)
VARLWAQTTTVPNPGIGFDVASINPATPLNPRQVMTGQQRIGMKVDAGRVDIANLSLADLVRIAYRVKRYQVVGPDWIKGTRFNIVGKIPGGGSPDQAPEMLQDLLTERFKLAVHRETKDHAVYALMVGKNGPKLVEAKANVAPPAKPAALAPPGGSMQLSEDASNLMVAGEQIGTIRVSQGAGGSMRLEAPQATMAALAEMLSRILDRPVVDMTRLKGAYELTLDLSMQDMHAMVQAAGVMPPGPVMGGGDMLHRTGPDAPGGAQGSDAPTGSVFLNIQQLGLKLETRKAPMEMIVIDHLEKAPVEN